MGSVFVIDAGGAHRRTHAAVEAVVRMESARLIAGLARLTGDVGLAEELAQDAVVAALEQWPRDGVPRNPGAWLMTVARRRAIDQFRRNRTLETRYAEIGRNLEAASARDDVELERVVAQDIDDDVLRLVFVACHPVLAVPARVALTLRLLGGLTTVEIARAFLLPEPTIAQRIVRAKRALTAAAVPFEVPAPEDRTERLVSVLDVIYLVFNEGYAATSGEDLMRPALAFEALRLGRVLAALMPDEPEVHGLVALMEIQSSRTATRVDAAGSAVLLLDQDRGRWDRLLINRGLASLARVQELDGSGGRFALQGAIAAVHARAFRAKETDWSELARLYAELMTVTPSPVVELNRAVAVSMASGSSADSRAGPVAALVIVDALADVPAMATYHLWHSVRADLLDRLGRPGEAAAAFDRAAELTRNEQERAVLRQRRSRLRW